MTRFPLGNTCGYRGRSDAGDRGAMLVLVLVLRRHLSSEGWKLQSKQLLMDEPMMKDLRHIHWGSSFLRGA